MLLAKDHWLVVQSVKPGLDPVKYRSFLGLGTLSSLGLGLGGLAYNRIQLQLLFT